MLGRPCARRQRVGQDAGGARLYDGKSGQVLFHWTGYAKGDRAADFVAGAPALAKKSQASVGAAFAWRGNLPLPLAAWQGANAGARLGAAVTGLGNVDKRPPPEILIGAPGDATGGYAAGAVSVQTVP